MVKPAVVIDPSSDLSIALFSKPFHCLLTPAAMQDSYNPPLICFLAAELIAPAKIIYFL
jgi:hypothetical protein